MLARVHKALAENRFSLQHVLREAQLCEVLLQPEQEHWLGAYRAYMEAMARAGILKDSKGLHPTSAATTVRVVNDKPQVLDGPYADSKEQLGGFHLIEVPDLDAALAAGDTARKVTLRLYRRSPSNLS